MAKNYELYKTVGDAILAFNQEKNDIVFNLAGGKEGTSAGRFLDWIFHNKSFSSYPGFKDAVISYITQSKELVYNIDSGTSAGRFIAWLWEDAPTKLKDKDDFDKLMLPCPFCGGKAEIIFTLGGAPFPSCKNCSASLEPFNSGYAAVEAWNKRVSK